MANIFDFRGIVVPIITPLHEDETVDRLSFQKCINHVIAGGVHGLFVNSTTGEATSLLDSEREKVIQSALQTVQQKVPLLVGISDTSTRRVMQHLEITNSLPIDAVVLHPFFFYPLNTPNELVRFFNTVASHSRHPLLLYNIPGTTKIAISLEVVRQLMKNENIIGIKDSSVDFLNLIGLIELKQIRPDFKIFIGKSHLWTSGILEGADGGLDGLSNLVPGLCVQLYNLISEQKTVEAYALQKRLNEIWKIYEGQSQISALKTALNWMKLCPAVVAHPTVSVTEEEKVKIKQILLAHQLI